MSSSSVATPPGVNPARPVADAVSPETIQRLIDRVAGFNLFVRPAGGDIAGGNGSTGFVLNETLHRFDVTMQAPTAQGIQAANILGEAVGKVDIRWYMIP